ncbi:MAG: hypothetical protein R2939_20285 [Kofleriaceae bacterium]
MRKLLHPARAALRVLPLSLILACGGDDAPATPDAAPTPDAADTTAPAAPTDFEAAVAGASVNLTWTNPTDADFAGVVLVRSVASASGGAPTAASAAGDTVGTGSVLYSDDAELTTDATPAPGTIVYELWSYDTAGNLAGPAVAQAVVPIPPQTASITIDPAALTLTVTSAPTLYGLTGTVELKRASFTYQPNYGSGIRFEAVADGAAGNGPTIALVTGGDPAQAPVVTVVGTDVSVTYARDVHTNKEIAAALNGDAAASAIMTATALVDGIQLGNLNPSALTGGADDVVVAHLALTNTGVNRLVFNAKAMVTALSDGTGTGAGTLDSTPAIWFGAKGLEIGGAAGEGFLEISGYSAATITASLTLRDDPTVIVPARQDSDLLLAIDSSGAGGWQIGTGGPLEYGEAFNEYPGTRGVDLTQDGRFLISGSRTTPQVLLIDMTTLEPVVGANIGDGTGVGTVETVRLSADETTLYAVVNHGRHASNYYSITELTEGGNICKLGDGTCLGVPPTAELIKLSFPALAVQQRLTLLTDSAVDGRARDFDMSADGSVAAIPLTLEGKVAIVDLTTMSLRSTVDVSGVNVAPREVAVSPDGSKTYVGYRSNQPGDEREQQPRRHAVGHRQHDLRDHVAVAARRRRRDLNSRTWTFRPDGKLYVRRKRVDVPTPLAVYTPTTDTWSTVDLAAGRSYLLAFAADDTPSSGTATPPSCAGSISRRGTHTSLGNYPGGYGHGIAVTVLTALRRHPARTSTYIGAACGPVGPPLPVSTARPQARRVCGPRGPAGARRPMARSLL